MGTTGDIGSAFDDFLEEEDLLESCEAAAEKKVLSYQIRALMEERGLTKSAMARQMGTSRSSLERLLDPTNESVTLGTLQKAARATGQRVELRLVPAG